MLKSYDFIIGNDHADKLFDAKNCSNKTDDICVVTRAQARQNQIQVAVGRNSDFFTSAGSHDEGVGKDFNNEISRPITPSEIRPVTRIVYGECILA